ncbi:hypothetical protein AgCh_012551 [Apium graveolens]
MPRKGVVKCNVHSFFSKEALPNGKRLGIGAVFRDYVGVILHMIGGSLRFEDQRKNEFHALLEVFGGRPQYEHVMWQLNERKADKNYKCELRLVDREANELAAYIAEYGANH